MQRLRPFAFALPLLLATPAVRASQYPLDQAAAIITSTEAQKLRRAGVRTTADFLTWGRTPDGRRMLAERAGLGLEQITGWVMMADLMRVRGIGPDVARLLTAVGVKSIADLKKVDAESTAASIREANSKRHLSTNPPGAESIRYWVEQAMSLPVIVALD
jgi:predicted flap endonuclease-1-like 5' DNA nuclease